MDCPFEGQRRRNSTCCLAQWKPIDPEAEEKVAELGAQLGSRGGRTILRALENQVAGFDFEAAAQSLLRLRQHFDA